MLPIVKREMEMDEDNKCEVKRIKQEQVDMTPGSCSTEMANLEIDEKKPIVKAEDTASDGQLAEGESDEEDQEGGGPSTRLRKRTAEPTKERKADKPQGKKQANNGKKNVKAGPTVKRPVGQNEARMEKFEEAEYKKYICPECGNMFSRKYLVQHMWVHTRDRPYSCAGCNHEFRFSSGSSRHRKKTGHLVRRTKESSRFKIVNGALVEL